MRLGYLDIGEDEAVALDDLAALDGNGPTEHRPSVGERMKLAALAARIDRRGQFGEQSGVEVATGEAAIEHPRIDAREPRDKAGGHHLARESGSVGTEQGEDRGQARAGEALFPVATNVFEKEIAKRHVSETLVDRPVDRGSHRTLVDFIGAGHGDRN